MTWFNICSVMSGAQKNLNDSALHDNFLHSCVEHFERSRGVYFKNDSRCKAGITCCTYCALGRRIVNFKSDSRSSFFDLIEVQVLFLRGMRGVQNIEMT